MQNLKSTINSNLKKYKIEDKIKSVQVCQCWEKVVSELLPNAAQKTIAIKLEKGVLKVASLSREIAYEISLFREKLIEALNALVGKRIVFSIYCEF